MSKTMLHEVAAYVVTNQIAATSTIQRQLRIGFGKVVQLLTELEQIGVVGPADGSRARDVLVPHTGLQAVLVQVAKFEAGAST